MSDETRLQERRNYVFFEESGERREILRYCDRCQADSDFTILSPRGTAHLSSETGEKTRCGIDATGENWWHRL